MKPSIKPSKVLASLLGTALLLAAPAPIVAQTTNPAQSMVDPASLNPDAVNMASFLGDIVEQAIQATKEHTIPGSIASMTILQSSLNRFETADSLAKAQSTMRIAEMHLRLMGNPSMANLIAAGARNVERNSPTMTTAYMRGVAQDLRAAGSVAAAQYLENTAILVTEGLYETSTGILDAASLAMRYGVTPQPGLAEFLAVEITEITDTYMQGLIADLMTHFYQVTNDPTYQALAERAASLTPEDVVMVQERIRQAVAQRNQQSSERFTTTPMQTPQAQPNLQNMLNGN